jgi:hypothetical protein
MVESLRGGGESWPILSFVALFWVEVLTKLRKKKIQSVIIVWGRISI